MIKTIFLVFSLISVIYCTSIGVFNTGVNSDGSLSAFGSVDSHYDIIYTPSQATGVPMDAYVAYSGTPQSVGYIGDATSQWISVNANVDQGFAFGNFDYRTSFDLTGLDPESAALFGYIAADDSVDIRLNGVDTGLGCGSCWTFDTSFSITSGFIAGVNTLDFIVYNGGGPTGLNVQISGSANPAIPNANAFCNGRNPSDWANLPAQQGYYCANSNQGFMQCWGQPPYVQGAYQNCAPTTFCQCTNGNTECSQQNIASPCA